MKTHILYIGLVLAAVALGTLAGSSLLAPAGLAVQPENDKGGIAPPAGAPIQPEDGKGGIAAPVPPGPGNDMLSQEIKLRHTLQGPSKVSTFPGARFSLAFSADGKTLVGAQNIWTPAEAKEGNPMRDGLASVYSGMKGWVKLWGVATGKEQTSSDVFQGGVASFALTADGKTLAMKGLFEENVRLRDVASGKERVLVVDGGHGESSYLAYLAFTPDGKTLAVSCKDFVKLWDVRSGKERACLKPCGPYCRLAVSGDGKLLAAVTDCFEGTNRLPKQVDGAVTLWDVASGQQRDDLPDSGSGFLCAAFSPDGKTLLAGGPGIVLWDVATCQELAPLKAHKGRVEALAFTADGKTLASASGHSDSQNIGDRLESKWGLVKLWDTTSGKVKATLKGFPAPPTSLAFAPDGSTLATFALGEIKLWDMPVSKQADK